MTAIFITARCLTIFQIQIFTNTQYELHRSEFRLPSYDFFRKKLTSSLLYYQYYYATPVLLVSHDFFRTSLERCPNFIIRLHVRLLSRSSRVQSIRTCRYFGFSILAHVKISNFHAKSIIFQRNTKVQTLLTLETQSFRIASTSNSVFIKLIFLIIQIARSFWNAQNYFQDYYKLPTFSDTHLYFI